MKTVNTRNTLRRLPAQAWAENSKLTEFKLPDWHFLVAIFKQIDAPYEHNGETKYEKNTLTQAEIDLIRLRSNQFEEYMNSLGVMNAHVDVIEISIPVTSLTPYAKGPWVAKDDAFPILEKAKIDLTMYDHVTGMAKFDSYITQYAGRTKGGTGIGTGYSFHNVTHHYSHKDPNNWWPVQVFVHEFLHVMEKLSRAWGIIIDEHKIYESYEPNKDHWKACCTDIILNRAKGEGGTGVPRFVWDYPPTVLRKIQTLNVPDGALAIRNFAFQGMENLTGVTIPASVRSIGKCAFRDCSNLETVTLPEGLSSIGEQAFRDCPKLVTEIPDSVKTIGLSAFQNCAMTEVTIPSGVTAINDWTFTECANLVRVNIPASVQTIGKCAFRRCPNLETVTLRDGLSSIGEQAFRDCPKLVTEIPDSVKTIGLSAFQNCAMTEVTIPSGVTAINDWTFTECANLVRVNIPASVQTIGKCAFRRCPNLETVTLWEGLSSIGEQAFRDCPKLVTDIPDSVKTIGLSAFQNCAMTEVTIPSGVTAINDWTFTECANLARVNIPASVQTIGKCAFRRCPNLETVTLWEGLSSIGEQAFRDCPKLVTEIPDSVKTIGIYAFQNCAMTEVTIPSGVTIINSRTFKECANLTKVNIPVSVGSIGEAAFYGNTLQDVYYGGTEAQWNAIQIDKLNHPLKNAAIHFQST